MKDYPSKLFHKTPSWVPDTAIFHVRIRIQPGSTALTEPTCAAGLLDSVERYAESGKWSCYLMLLMPDHLHALLSFGREVGMSETLRNWKRGQARILGIRWQDGYFDHRIRNAEEYAEKFAYIERNPVACGLCGQEGDWPWRTAAFAKEAVPKF